MAGKGTAVTKLVGLCGVLALVACGDSGPSKQDSFAAFGAATVAMANAQSQAVQDAQQAVVAPAELTLDFTGACPAGGTVAVTGTYDTSGSGQNAAFDMTTTFDACADAQGTIDGQLRWTSVVDGTRYTATMKGAIDWAGQNGSASCDFDLQITVDGQTVTYAGSICGYDMSELNGR